MVMVWCFFIVGLIFGLLFVYFFIEEEIGILVLDFSIGNGIMYFFFGWGIMII